MSILLARQYGPEGLGLISTANAVVVLVVGFSALGLSGVLIRELVENQDSRGTIIMSVVLGKLATGLVLFFGLMLSIWLFADNDQLVFLTFIIGTGFLFSSLDPFDALYNARSDFIRLVSLRLLALVASSAVKLVAIIGDLGLGVVALGYALDFVVMYVLPLSDFLLRRHQGQREELLHFNWSWPLLRSLIKRSWPLLISGGFAQINLKLDTILIAGMVSVDQVGIYTAAVRLSEAWSVVGMAIVTAAFPALIVAARSDMVAYSEKLEKLFRTLIGLALMGAVVVALISGPLIDLLYGADFSAAAGVLVVHIFGGVFLFIRTAVSRWLVIEDLLKFSLVSHAAGAVINVGLNLILIPLMGIQGAAWSSLASYAVSGVLFLAFTRRTRSMFILICTAILPGRLKGNLTHVLVAKIVKARS